MQQIIIAFGCGVLFALGVLHADRGLATFNDWVESEVRSNYTSFNYPTPPIQLPSYEMTPLRPTLSPVPPPTSGCETGCWGGPLPPELQSLRI
jgi:hypothetical protein